MPTNAERRLWAERALMVSPYEEYMPEDPETAITDLLADLMHYCQARDDLEFRTILQRAEYLYETDEED